MKLTTAQKGGIISVCIGVVFITAIIAGSVWYSGYKTETFNQCMSEVQTIVGEHPEGVITETQARKFCVALSKAYLFKRDFEVLGNDLEYDHSVRLYMPK